MTMKDLDGFLLPRRGDAVRPLLGLTLLAVEDSRFASEALRLLCQRSGARLRRADSLRAARRHLAVYRPTAVAVDIGLPDGSGLELVSELARASQRVGAVIAMSADPAEAEAARDAGADGFLPKPVESLASFQAFMLAHLPHLAPEKGRPRPVSEDDRIRPDALALQDDLVHAEHLLARAPDEGTLRYAGQFVGALAAAAGDSGLARAAAALRATPAAPAAAQLGGLLRQRLQKGAAAM
jgi:CheY-like chemotaxis protein